MFVHSQIGPGRRSQHSGDNRDRQRCSGAGVGVGMLRAMPDRNTYQNVVGWCKGGNRNVVGWCNVAGWCKGVRIIMS